MRFCLHVKTCVVLGLFGGGSDGLVGLVGLCGRSIGGETFLGGGSGRGVGDLSYVAPSAINMIAGKT
ncbi:unnamed protein product [Cylicostephanus goldi]|uniref:Uncharacterized protein n=1 Tax=Cylicostephanus goldi TaxID=71465 RepID=A0A3P7NEB7_CYLGO|nr:unnamed protein product [Cylicostephanus goldi]